MDIKEKFAMLEDMLELEEGTLKETTVLDNLEEWDSMTKLSLIVMMDDDFDKKISGDQIKTLKSVKDILNMME